MLTICQMKPEWETSKGSHLKFLTYPQRSLWRLDISTHLAIHTDDMSHFNYSTPVLKLACTPSSCHSSNLSSILQQIKRIYSKPTHAAHVTLVSVSYPSLVVPCEAPSSHSSAALTHKLQARRTIPLTECLPFQCVVAL